MLVSKMLKEHFMDYESHTVTQPPLQQKLEILNRHLQKSKIGKKAAAQQPSAKARPQSSSVANMGGSSTAVQDQRRTSQRPGSTAKPSPNHNTNNPSGNANTSSQKPPTTSS